MSLDVHLYGGRIGSLSRFGGDSYRFAYAPERLAELGRGSTVLSNSMPVADEPYSPDTSRAFVEGLLPEGMRRIKLARELGVDPGDGYALIAELGRDCAGAVVFLPEGAPVPDRSVPSVAWASDDELEEVLTSPPGRLLDPNREQRMRFSLPGVRHKLGLARARPGGRWVWPEAGRPSTHIVKPETGEHPEMVPNEMFCTTVVGQVGLLVAPTAIETIADVPASSRSASTAAAKDWTRSGSIRRASARRSTSRPARRKARRRTVPASPNPAACCGRSARGTR